MSGPNSSNLNPLDYEVNGNAGVLIHADIEVRNISPSSKMHFS